MARDPSQLVLEVRLLDGYGRVHGAIVREVPKEAAYNGPRYADDFKFELSMGAVPMEQAVNVLKVKEIRRKLLVECAANAGAQLADFLQDREGWHGLDRQEAVEKRLKDQT